MYWLTHSKTRVSTVQMLKHMKQVQEHMDQACLTHIDMDSTEIIEQKYRKQLIWYKNTGVGIEIQEIIEAVAYRVGVYAHGAHCSGWNELIFQRQVELVGPVRPNWKQWIKYAGRRSLIYIKSRWQTYCAGCECPQGSEISSRRQDLNGFSSVLTICGQSE